VLLAVFLFSLSEITVLAGDVSRAVYQLFDSSGVIQVPFCACTSACLCCMCFVAFACLDSRKQ
jgi:hypothetical protein